MVEFLIEGDITIASSRIPVPVALATVLPGVVTPVSGTVVAQPPPGTVVFTDVSATIRGSPGVLYSIYVAGDRTPTVAGPGTLLVLDTAATIIIVPVAPAGFVPVTFGPGGVAFSTLIASVFGTLGATFVVS